MALNDGVSGQGISGFLTGVDPLIKPDEERNLIFAQHFADARRFAEAFAFDSIVTGCGERQADSVRPAVQIMIAGSMYDINMRPLKRTVAAHSGVAA